MLASLIAEKMKFSQADHLRLKSFLFEAGNCFSRRRPNVMLTHTILIIYNKIIDFCSPLFLELQCEGKQAGREQSYTKVKSENISR